MQQLYKCLIADTLKELPTLEFLIQSYPGIEREVLQGYLDTTRETLKDGQTRAGAVLYRLHCRYSYLKTFRLEFYVNKQIVPRSFNLEREVKVKDLQEALAAAEITIEALQGSEWLVTLNRIYDSDNLIVWDCEVGECLQEEHSQDYKLVFSVNNKASVSEFYKIFSTESENLAKQEGFDIAREFSTEDSIWSLTRVEDEEGNVVCRVKNTALTPQLYKLTYLIKNSVSNQEELFYRVVSALSLKEVRIKSLDLASVFEFPSFNITAELVAIEDEVGVTVWQAQQSEHTKD